MSLPAIFGNEADAPEFFAWKIAERRHVVGWLRMRGETTPRFGLSTSDLFLWLAADRCRRKPEFRWLDLSGALNGLRMKHELTVASLFTAYRRVPSSTLDVVPGFRS